VLVVDDTAANRNMMEVFLRKLGFDSIAAKDGREAVDVFKRERPDLILMDLMMPEMDGFEATRQIRRCQGEQWVPIIIMSALNSDQDIVAGLEAEADDYLVKPVSFAIFSAKLRTFMRLLNMQRSLASAVERMQSISNAVIDGIITISEEGEIRSMNPAACKIFGYQEAEVVGGSIRALMSERDAREHDDHLRDYVSGGEAHIIGQLRNVTGIRKNGEQFPMELGVNDVRLPDGRIFLGVVRDVTEQQRVQRELSANAARLQDYHDEQELEQELARTILERQIRKEGLGAEGVQFALVPANKHFSGDVAVVARSPQGWTYAMLADATGHGLGAAISVLPALTLFYRGAQRNAPVDKLVAEMNEQLHENLPVGRFVAAAVLRIDQTAGRAEVWVGGVPDVLLLGPDGRVARRFESAQLPLGVVSNAEQSCVPQICSVTPGQQFLLCSDGVIEAQCEGEELFGEARLEAALAECEPSRRVKGVLEVLSRHLGGKAGHDDMSLLLLDCHPALARAGASTPA
jgi:PAS domain S-box-containing protein